MFQSSKLSGYVTTITLNLSTGWCRKKKKKKKLNDQSPLWEPAILIMIVLIEFFFFSFFLIEVRSNLMERVIRMKYGFGLINIYIYTYKYVHYRLFLSLYVVISRPITRKTSFYGNRISFRKQRDGRHVLPLKRILWMFPIIFRGPRAI